MADFYVGERGDPLTVTMPFDATGEGQTAEIFVRKPGEADFESWGAGTLAPTTCTRTIAENDLDVAGTYEGEVRITRPDPERLRIVRFTLKVVGR